MELYKLKSKNEPESLSRLRRLVEQMDKGEKLLFKRFLRMYSQENNQQSRHAQLFDCVNDVLMAVQKELVQTGRPMEDVRAGSRKRAGLVMAPDERFWVKFQKRFYSRAFLPAIQLPAKCDYLYDRILESMRIHQANQSIKGALSAGLLDMSSLDLKGLKGDGVDMITDMKAKALQIEDWPSLLDLMSDNTQFESRELAQNWYEEMQQIVSQKQDYLQIMQATMLVKDLSNYVNFALRDKHALADDPWFERMFSQYCQYLRSDGEIYLNSSFKLALQHYILLTLLCRIPDLPACVKAQFPDLNSGHAIAYHQKIIALYEKFPHFKAEEPIRYFARLANYLSNAITQKNGSDFEMYIGEFQKFPPKDPAYLDWMIHMMLLWYIANKEFRQAEEFVQSAKVWEAIISHGAQISVAKKQSIINHAGIILFVRGQYRQAGRFFELNILERPSGIMARRSFEASHLYYALARFEDDGNIPKYDQQEILAAIKACFAGSYDPAQKDSFKTLAVNFLQEMFKKMNKNEPLSTLFQQYMEPLKLAFARERRQVDNLGLLIPWLQSRIEKKHIANFIGEYI